MFFLIDLAEKFEDKRFKLAIVIESFLLGCLLWAKSGGLRILNYRYSSLYFVMIVVALSIFVRSFGDIGYQSMALIDATNVTLEGQKYYGEFADNNWPLFFYFNLIPVLFAKYSGLSEFVVVDWWSNIIGVLGIYFSSKILLKSEFLRKNKVLFNLLIAGFALGYFLRVFTLVYGEFGTKSSYFLIFSYIYFSYFLITDDNLTRFDEICIGVVAALLFCLKPHYGFIVIGVEFYRAFKRYDWRLVFCLRNYVTMLLSMSYLAVVVFYYPELLDDQHYKNHDLRIVISDFYPNFLVIFLLYFFVSRDLFLEKILFFSFCFILIPVIEMIGGYDQRFVSYSMLTSALFVSLAYILNKNLLDYKKYWFLFGIVFLAMQFDSKDVLDLLVNFVFLWWVFVLVDVFYYKRKFFDGLVFWLVFVALSSVSVVFLFNQQYYEIGWVFNSLIFVYYIFLHEKTRAADSLSKVASIILIAVLGYVFSLYWQAVVGLKNYPSVQYKTPNYVSEQIVKVVSSNGGDFIVISNSIRDLYPAKKVIGSGDNNPLILGYASLYELLIKEDEKYLDISKHNQYLLDSIKKKILDKTNKTILIKKVDLCSIGFLEFYFGDLEFKKQFLDNYEFKNRILDVEEDYLNENLYVGEFYEIEGARAVFNIVGDYEVYVRKE